jgi:Fe-S oxidoreductase
MVWEYLAESDFPFPDYAGIEMTIHDPCNVRGKDSVYNAVRKLLQRMNIHVTESEKTRKNSVCCGAAGYGTLSEDKILELARKRAADLPCDDVAVYCTSCMYNLRDAGKNTHHLIDLIFNEKSAPTPMKLKEWRESKSEYMKNS